MKFTRMLFSRFSFIAAFILLQVAVLIVSLVYMRDKYAIVQFFYYFLSLVIIIYILNKEGHSSYKTAWVITIALLPIFGTAMYIVFGQSRLPQSRREELCGMQHHVNPSLLKNAVPVSELSDISQDAFLQAQYLVNNAYAPMYRGTETKYFETGEKLFEDILESLRKAEKFIYLEYFIIGLGSLWDEVLEILEEKAKAGVDVRVIYDDIGSILTLPRYYCNELNKRGIKCGAFHRFLPVMTGTINNRDHRKICVVDGHTAYTGGANIADEYVNRISRFGTWQDCGVRVHGTAAFSFTVMFISMWNYIYNVSEPDEKFVPEISLPSDIPDDGYVIPYADTPVDDEHVGQTVYLNMISRAKKYVYICTPYLILDEETATALMVAAKSGIDVRIITPGVPDKQMVYAVTRSYYSQLIEAGVRIYEFMPGFIHSKTVVCDDEYAVCGTINFDYRSLFLHHECAVWMYRSSAIFEMRDSYLSLLDKCALITKEIYYEIPWYKRVFGNVLRIASALL
ncbi:MAG: cardiolipin synthase [Ruminococcaceae bacterium]|nr:cardiolipin synthase [Oscillospiraceae bacterium]